MQSAPASTCCCGVGDEDGDELLHEERPGAVVGVHQLLGFDVVARAAAFDHVAGEGEGRAAEADDAEAVAVGAGRGEVRGYFFDGLGDVGEVFGAIGAEGLDVLEGADGGVDLRGLRRRRTRSRGPWG